MSTIRAHEFVSLDGVYEDPSWTQPFGFTDAMGQTIGALTASSSALLLGRRTWQMFAPAWSQRTSEDDPGASFFKESTKYVVSSTLSSTEEWQNSTVVGGYDTRTIRGLDGDLYVSGSGTLVRALIADGLLDELHVFVYPVVLGRGARLFPEQTPKTTLSLAGHEAYDNGVVHLTYAPAVTG